MSPKWSAQPVNIFKNLASAEEQGRGKGGGVMALKTSCRTGPLPKYWGCASALDTALGMCLSVCVCARVPLCVRACMCVCVLLYVCPGACACVCMGVTECVPVCDRAVAGLPGELVVLPVSSVAV